MAHGENLTSLDVLSIYYGFVLEYVKEKIHNVPPACTPLKEKCENPFL